MMRDPRSDLGIRKDRVEIFTHLGIVVSLASTIDARMIQLGSYLTDRANPNAARIEWRNKK